jgi:hypothetical protein
MSTLKIALYITAILHGTLHGQPKDLRHEFQIRFFSDIAACEARAAEVAEKWVKDMSLIGLNITVSGVRCDKRKEVLD